MEKQVLSHKQMNHLKDLGVDTSNASMVMIFTDEESNILGWEDVVMEYAEHGEACQYFYIEDGIHKMAYASLLDANYGDYDHSYRKQCGVFTLQDILEILPSRIKGHSLSIYMDYKYMSYDRIDAWDRTVEYQDMIFDFTNKSFVNAAYDALCWCVINDFLNK